jgi:hypothetical protein
VRGVVGRNADCSGIVVLGDEGVRIGVDDGVAVVVGLVMMSGNGMAKGKEMMKIERTTRARMSGLGRRNKRDEVFLFFRCCGYESRSF